MSLANLEESVETVVGIIGGASATERGAIRTALQNSNCNVDAVLGEYFDLGTVKFVQRHSGWDESVFGSNREGDQSTFTQNTNPSFAIHAPDEIPILHGQDPNAFYGPPAPSRPPSRANNRSPLSRTVELTAGDLSAIDKEDAQLQQAINESLQLSNSQSQGQFPAQVLPPPPPLPQQSGVLSAGETSGQYFGPATRTDYEESEWALTRYQRVEMDPKASQRARKPNAPVFLRQRVENLNHRIGGILTVFNEIPAARNALLHTGQLSNNYGNSKDWWCGGVINTDVTVAAGDGEAVVSYPKWHEELHRLVAFMNFTTRSYGTADILAQSRSNIEGTTGNVERDFFEELDSDPEAGSVFRTSVEIVYLSEENSPGTLQSFTLLDNQYRQEALRLAENLNNIWDMIFYADAGDDPDTARMAMITDPGEIITCRWDGDEWPNPIQMPETFYIDRYLASNRDQMMEIQRKVADLSRRYQQNHEWEASLKMWFNPKTQTYEERLALNPAGIERCRNRIMRIKNLAQWRTHQEAVARGEQVMYIDSLKKDPVLLPDETEAIKYYERQIQVLEAHDARFRRIMTEQIEPERKQLEEESRRLGSLLTGPSEDPRWNATHKYTLRGVVRDPETVFVRKYEQILIEDVDDPVAQWWKLHWNQDNTLLVEESTYEAAMTEACSKGCKPIVIYATETAMDETPEEIPVALKTFVRFDNKHFKDDLKQEELEKATQKEESQAEKSQDEGVDDMMREMALRSTMRAVGTGSKARRDSLDSLATNQSSLGPRDDDNMGDAPPIFEEEQQVGDDTVMSEAPLVDVEQAEKAKAEPMSGQEMQEKDHAPLMIRSA